MAATGFSDLDELLDELTAGLKATLGEDLVGLYLQGSFALGDGDEHSDVDWIAVTEDEPSSDQVARLQRMHARLHALDTTWAQHLEGSSFRSRSCAEWIRAAPSSGSSLEALPAEWRSLIQDALDDRPDPWTKVGRPAAPDTLERTFAFVDYAVSRPRPPRP